MNITYLPWDEPVYRHKNPPKKSGYDRYGYCRKGSTDFYVKPDNKGRKHRVWCTCLSNCASFWIVRNGLKVHLHNVYSSDVINEQ